MKQKHASLADAKWQLYVLKLISNDPGDDLTWHKISPENKAKALEIVRKATGIDIFTSYKLLSGTHTHTHTNTRST